MDEYSGKRLAVPRKGSNLVMRNPAENRDGDAQFCNRLGCNGRLNHARSAQNGCSERYKSASRPSFRASSSKEIIGSSTMICSTVTNTRKTLQESQKKPSSQLKTDPSEMSSIRDEPEVSEFVHSPIQTRFESEINDTESGKVSVESSSTASSSRLRKAFRQKSGLGTRDALLSSSIPLASERACQGARNSGNASSYGRKFRCSSISDVIPSGCSSSEPNLSRRKDTVKKRNLEVRTSSICRDKKTSGPLFEDSQSSASTNGISISESRRVRNWHSSRDDGIGSVRTRRSINSSSTRMRVSNPGNVNCSTPVELPILTEQVPQPEITAGLDVPSSSHQFLAEASLSHSTYSHSSSSGSNSPEIMPIGPSEIGITRSLINRGGLRLYNMDGIAEVLLALERIEQDEELSYEQLLALETNLFLGGLGFYDQHRDMRLDIDNMSYEELLALEEKMGTVSTALPEEALLKCLKRSIYQPPPLKERAMGCEGDEDIKCSICQEEYVIGDEVGRLECEHVYHVVCVQQWLRLKNWCPICKASAARHHPSQ